MIGFLYALICLIWGSTWLAIKVGLAGVPPFLGAGLRFFAATILVGLILAFRRRSLALSADDKACVASLAILVFFMDYACVYWAEQHISSGLTAVLFSTMPLMTALLSRFWTRAETLSGKKLAGILIGVAGTALLFWPQDRVGPRETLGMLASLAASLGASINLVVMKRHGKESDPHVLNLYGMGIGTVLLLALSASTESWSGVAWTTANVLAIVYCAVFGSVIAFSAYYTLIKRLDATTVSLSNLIIPIVALALGAVFLGESVTVLSLAGIAAILVGVAVASL